MKNIVLVITDTYRYDNLGDRSSMPVRTPNLDRFAAEKAISIEKCHTGSFPTIPHRTDVATGTVGWPHYPWQAIDQSGPNHIARILQDCGYATQLICDTPHLFNARFQQGFTGAFQHRGQEGDKALLCLNKPIQPAMPMEKTRRRPTFRGHPLVDTHRWINRYWENENQTFPYRTAETAVQWLEENYLAGPFFLWVDFFDPHEPWDAPEYLVKRYDPDYSGIPMLHPNYGPSAEYTDSELRNLRAHYNAEAELIDRWVGRLLGKLDDLQLWDDTIVLLTTDHGMSLGEHGRTGKSNIHEDDPRFWPLYPEISHVPLMLAGGGIPGGRSANAIVHPADFLPTLCELAEVEANPPKPFDGKSFAAVARGETETHRDFTVAGCFSRGKDGKVPAHCSTPFVVTERWGYTPIGATGKPELFDLEADPLAADNVIGEDPATARDLHALLAEHLKTCQAPGEVVDLWTKSAGSGEGSWSIDY